MASRKARGRVELSERERARIDRVLIATKSCIEALRDQLSDGRVWTLAELMQAVKRSESATCKTLRTLRLQGEIVSGRASDGTFGYQSTGAREA